MTCHSARRVLRRHAVAIWSATALMVPIAGAADVPRVDPDSYPIHGPTPERLDSFGRGLAAWQDGLQAVAGAPGPLHGASEHAGAAFLIDTTNGDLLAEFVPDDGAIGDHFGFAVDVRGVTVAIGAPGASVDGTAGAGAVYLFDRATQTQLLKLVADDAAADARFGASVSIGNQVVVVGAPGDAVHAPNSGAAYIFDRQTGVQLARLDAPTHEENDQFGTHVGIDGNHIVVCAHYFYDTIVKGAYFRSRSYQYRASDAAFVRELVRPDGGILLGAGLDLRDGHALISWYTYESELLEGSGAAWLFDLSDGTALTRYRTSQSHQSTGPQVALGDDLVAVVVDPTGHTTSEEVAFFDRATGVEVHRSPLRTRALVMTDSIVLTDSPDALVRVYDRNHQMIAADGAAGDRFGAAVALSETHGIIGATEHDGAGDGAGAAYLFDPRTHKELARIVGDDTVAGDAFGTAVDIHGAYAIVGARFADAGGADSGAAYIFDVETGAQLRKLLPPDGMPDDAFGRAVAINETYAVVGAFRHDGAGEDAGAIYVFETQSGEPLWTLTPDDAEANDRFGLAVDLDGATIIAGSYFDDDLGPRSGSASLFDAASGTQLRKLVAPDGAAEDRFGQAVAINGAHVLIGAWGHDGDGDDAGIAYLMDHTTGALVHTLHAPSPTPGSAFGWNVDLDDAHALISAPFGPIGTAARFDRLTGALLDELSAPPEAANGEFGIDIALAGAHALAGAWLTDDRAANAGAAYVFDAPPPCSADLDGDGAVGLGDLVQVLADWGPCPGCAGDVNADGLVDFGDVLIVLGAWGPCRGE